MGTMRILEVEARRDAVDKLHWTVELRPEGWGTDIVLLLASWVGDVALFKFPVQQRSGVSPQTKHMRLATRWLRWHRDQPDRMWGHGTEKLRLETELPAGALTRLEEFRDDDTIYARIEGKMYMPIVRESGSSYSPEDEPHVRKPRWQMQKLWEHLSEFNKTLGMNFASESFEISRERWSRSILQPLGSAPATPSAPTASRAQPGLSLGSKNQRLEADFQTIIRAETALDQGDTKQCAELLTQALARARQHWKQADQAAADQRYGAACDLHISAMSELLSDGHALVSQPVTRHLLHCTKSLYQMFAELHDK